MKTRNMVLVIVVVLLIGGLLFCLPSIYKYTSKFKNDLNHVEVINSNDNSDDSKTEDKTKEFDKSILDDLVYPTIRNNENTTDTYFKLDKFVITQLSNNDILANTLKNVYEGYFENHGAEGCATVGKAIKATYLDVRIKNIISDSIDYNHSDFYVYGNEYPGLWKYDAGTNSYVYNGDCNPSSTKYYDLQLMKDYEVEDNNKKLIMKFKVAFAKVENGQYTIYKDVNMTQSLTSGAFVSVDELNKLLKGLDTNIYKYTYIKGLCSYDGYCLETGEWING